MLIRRDVLEYLNLLQALPDEMQVPLSQLICQTARIDFKTLPQAIIEFKIAERGYSGKEIKISPDKTIGVIENLSPGITVVDLIAK